MSRPTICPAGRAPHGPRCGAQAFPTCRSCTTTSSPARPPRASGTVRTAGHLRGMRAVLRASPKAQPEGLPCRREQRLYAPGPPRPRVFPAAKSFEVIHGAVQPPGFRRSRAPRHAPAHGYLGRLHPVQGPGTPHRLIRRGGPHRRRPQHRGERDGRLRGRAADQGRGIARRVPGPGPGRPVPRFDRRPRRPLPLERAHGAGRDRSRDARGPDPRGRARRDPRARARGPDRMAVRPLPAGKPLPASCASSAGSHCGRWPNASPGAGTSSPGRSPANGSRSTTGCLGSPCAGPRQPPGPWRPRHTRSRENP